MEILDRDEVVPTSVAESWESWKTALANRPIPRYYFPKEMEITSLQLHGFSDASEEASTGVVYLRALDSFDHIYTSLVVAKSYVSPLKCLDQSFAVEHSYQNSCYMTAMF